MENLIKQAELLKLAIKKEAKKIDNPVLTTSIVSELSNFIDYLKEGD